jgi:GNAT superfamily N-acetyltransferase
MYCSWANREFEIGTDPARIDLSVVHGFLSQSYWSPGVPLEVIRRGIENSICFGVYRGTQQVGFARVVTDRATFAYLADVFVLEPHRGLGLSKWLIECIMAHPDLQRLRRWMLATRDAHELYGRFGFTPLAKPERIMEKYDPDVYAGNQS